MSGIWWKHFGSVSTICTIDGGEPEGDFDAFRLVLVVCLVALPGAFKRTLPMISPAMECATSVRPGVQHTFHLGYRISGPFNNENLVDGPDRVNYLPRRRLCLILLCNSRF